jgi:ATP-binding cassette subfamily F protein 3
VNGAGKSTLIKLLAGSEQATSGELRLGHNADVDYFAQDQYKALDPNARMLDDLFEAAPRSTQTELRSLLGCFLFSEDDVFKTIGVLSGGERNRYALARMLLHPSNFLLLDEPTNHLDLRAKDVLLDSLQKFTGTVVFVSHDRYFIDKLATRVFEIGDGRVEIFPGNYEDYLWRKERKFAALDGEPSSAATLVTTAAVNHRETEAQATPEAKQKRLNPIKLKQMRERLEEVEEEIARLEAAITTAETALQNFVSVEETQRQTDLLARSREELQQRMSEWEEVSTVLES